MHHKKTHNNASQVELRRSFASGLGVPIETVASGHKWVSPTVQAQFHGYVARRDAELARRSAAAKAEKKALALQRAEEVIRLSPSNHSMLSPLSSWLPS